MEVAGLVVGILPVLVGVVQGYKTLSEKIRVFRHFSKEMKSVQVQFQVQRQVFSNECRLLLCMAVDDEVAKAMLKRPNHSGWGDGALDEQLQSCLRDNLDSCQALVDDIHAVLEDFGRKLASFDHLVAERNQDESIKSAIRRLRRTVALPLEKSSYDKTLSVLRERNTDLSTLRSHLVIFREKKTSSSRLKPKEPALNFTFIRSAAQKLHEVLSSSCCYNYDSPQSHYAKLGLGVELQEKCTVKLDLAISCQATKLSSNRGCAHEAPFWFYVQSTSVDDPRTSSGLSKRQCEFRQTEVHPSSLEKVRYYRKQSPTDSVIEQPTKRRRVRFADDDDDEPKFAPQTTSVMVTPKSINQAKPVNLCETSSLCHYLKQKLNAPLLDQAEYCLGYLESPELFRHHFYIPPTQQPALASRTSKGRTSVDCFTVDEYMLHSIEDSVTVVDQLRVAVKLTRAVLEYGSTPWLDEEWRLHNISFFGSQDGFSEESLHTLHISTRIGSQSQEIGDLPMEGDESIQNNTQQMSSKDYFGVNNMALFSLGIALLELGYWKPLRNLRNKNDLNDVLAVRRLSSRCTPLGPKYQELVQKCLQCNFGFGTDLEKPELQGAVYGDVVCQLESMIESLSI